MPVDAAGVQQDPQPVVGEAPESVAGAFDFLDEEVQAFGRAVRLVYVRTPRTRRAHGVRGEGNTTVVILKVEQLRFDTVVNVRVEA